MFKIRFIIKKAELQRLTTKVQNLNESCDAYREERRATQKYVETLQNELQFQRFNFVEVKKTSINFKNEEERQVS